MQHKEAILASYKRIAPFIHRTPVLTSEGIDKLKQKENQKRKR